VLRNIIHERYEGGEQAAAATTAAATTETGRTANKITGRTTMAVDPAKIEKEIPAVFVMISGSEDKQTSADVSNVGSFQLPDPQGRAGKLTWSEAAVLALTRMDFSNTIRVSVSSPILIPPFPHRM
jgi:hypothetical protein